MGDILYTSAQNSYKTAKEWLGNAFGQIEHCFKNSNELAGRRYVTGMQYNFSNNEAKVVDRSRWFIGKGCQKTMCNGEMSKDCVNTTNTDLDKSSTDNRKSNHIKELEQIEFGGSSALSQQVKCIYTEVLRRHAEIGELHALLSYAKKTTRKPPWTPLSSDNQNSDSKLFNCKFGKDFLELEHICDTNRQCLGYSDIHDIETEEKPPQRSKSLGKNVCISVFRKDDYLRFSHRSKLQDSTSLYQATSKSNLSRKRKIGMFLNSLGKGFWKTPITERNDELYIGSLKMYLQHFQNACQLRIGLCFVEDLQTDNGELVVHITLLDNNNKSVRKGISKTTATDSHKATFNEDIYIKTNREYTETGQLEVTLCKLSRRLRRHIPIGKTSVKLGDLDLFFDKTVYSTLFSQ